MVGEPQIGPVVLVALQVTLHQQSAPLPDSLLPPAVAVRIVRPQAQHVERAETPHTDEDQPPEVRSGYPRPPRARG